MEDFLQRCMIRLLGAIYCEHGLATVSQFVTTHVIRQAIDISSLLQSFDPKRDAQAQFVQVQYMYDAYIYDNNTQ